jgi:hypothetical protein
MTKKKSKSKAAPPAPTDPPETPEEEYDEDGNLIESEDTIDDRPMFDDNPEPYNGPAPATSNYSYYQNIKSPQQLGMKDKGSNIAKNFTGLISYVNLLMSGDSKASKTGHPLGNKFFASTMSKCKDTDTGETVPMHLYFDYIPTGQIKLEMDLTDVSNEVTINTNSKGLIPGIIEDLASIQPGNLLSVFGEPLITPCSLVTLDTVNAKNQLGAEYHYLSTNDIQRINPCSFDTNINPETNAKCKKPHAHATPRNPEDTFLEPPSLFAPPPESFSTSIHYYNGLSTSFAKHRLKMYIITIVVFLVLCMLIYYINYNFN